MNGAASSENRAKGRRKLPRGRGAAVVQRAARATVKTGAGGHRPFAPYAPGILSGSAVDPVAARSGGGGSAARKGGAA